MKNTELKIIKGNRPNAQICDAELSGFAENVIAEVVTPAMQQKLYKAGEQTAAIFWSAFYTSVGKQKARKEITDKVVDYLKPVVDPLVEGVQDGLSKKLIPTIFVGTLFVGGLMFLSYYLGKKSK